VGECAPSTCRKPPSPIPAPRGYSAAWSPSHDIHLDERGIVEFHGDCSAHGTGLIEQLPVDLVGAAEVAVVAEEGRDLDDVIERTSGRRQEELDVPDCLPRLGLDVVADMDQVDVARAPARCVDQVR
jgi:hypothetical protein